MLSGSISKRFVDNPDFQAFCNKLRPGYKLPSREYMIPKVLIPAEYQNVQQRVKKFAEDSDALSISTDGWTDITGKSILNFVILNPEPRLHSFSDVSEDGETGEVIAQKLIEIICEVNPNKVAAIVSDHAACMRKAWRLVNDKYPWIQGEGCKAHALNLIMHDIFSYDMYKEYKNSCSTVVKFFRYVLADLLEIYYCILEPLKQEKLIMKSVKQQKLSL